MTQSDNLVGDAARGRLAVHLAWRGTTDTPASPVAGGVVLDSGGPQPTIRTSSGQHIRPPIPAAAKRIVRVAVSANCPLDGTVL